jgi:hypothetical protein
MEFLSGFGWIAGALILIVALGIAGWYGYKWYKRDKKRFDKDIRR